MAFSGFKLSSDDGLPLYQQIAGGVRSGVDSGELVDGSRLPPIRALAQELGVNRDTVALAYEALAAEGLIESVVGRGTFVRLAGDERRGEPAGLELAAEVEQLLAIHDARPRYGVAGDVVQLHSLIPDPALYPVDDFRRAFNRAVAKGGADLFLYGGAQGHQGLRDVLAERFAGVGMAAESSDIVLCHGASQGISLAVRAFASAGEAIAVEGPTYHNVLTTLVGLGITPVTIPMTHEAADLAVLERELSRPEVKAFYTIPTFHNPMGTTTSVAHRRELLEVSARCGKPVIEDAFEMDLRCAGRPIAPLFALDGRGLVIHLFSFSKSLFPGARVGSVTAHGRTVDGLVALKHATDMSDSMPLQAAMAEFVADGGYERHLGRIRRMLRGRHEAVQQALEQHMPEGTQWTRPEGGYQVWVELPFDLDTRDLLADAARAGVLFSPGSHFVPDGAGGGLTGATGSRCLRLTLAQAGEAQIEAGVAALGRVVHQRMEARSVSRPEAGVHM